MNGLRDGMGTFSLHDGSTYKGNWKQDKFDGYGIRTFPSGYVYAGNYQDGQSHGFGKATFPPPSCDTYQGHWYKGLMHGLGTYTHVKQGDVYEGLYVNGKRHGPGRYRFKNYRTDIIEYSCGERVGRGVRWSKDGKKAWLLDGKNVCKSLSLDDAMKLQREICGDVFSKDRKSVV